MTPSCQTCRYFVAVKEQDVTLKFACLSYDRCRGGKTGAVLYDYSLYTERAWERWVRERKT